MSENLSGENLENLNINVSSNVSDALWWLLFFKNVVSFTLKFIFKFKYKFLWFLLIDPVILFG